jgi:hypothetical protein
MFWIFDKMAYQNNAELIRKMEKRAKAVVNELIKRYKVPSRNIVMEWKRTEKQPYKQNDCRRVVIMNSQ